jgi:peptide/nickel transport system substrate-binding protein
MTKRIALALASACVLAVPLTLSTTASGGQTGNCVKVGGVESSGEKNSLDPAVQPSSQNSLNAGLVYNRLTDRDDNWNVVPELATSWKPSKGGTVWTFQLRHGVKFHDGHELTSADVVYTFKRLMNPKTGSDALATMTFLKGPNAIQPAGKYAVRFVTQKPVAELPLLITNKNTYIVANGADDATIKQKGAGTGPFIAQDFGPTKEPNTFVRNPNYWEKGKPAADCIQLFVIQEATSRLAALRTGQIDLAQQVDFSSIPVLQKDQNVKLLSTGASTSMTFPMWVDTKPFNDNRVRLALKKVIDRDAMVKTVLLGYGVAGDDNPVPPSSPFAWRKSVPGPDVEGAKRLLAAAGYNDSNPLKIDMYSAEIIPGMVNLTQLFKEQAAKAGIDVNVIVGPAGEYWDNVWLKHPFQVSGWSARPPGEALAIAYRKTAPYPETHWKNTQYDSLLDRANTTINPKKRLALYRSAMKMLSLQGGELIPVFVKTVAGIRANCSGYQPRIEIVRADFRTVHCTR